MPDGRMITKCSTDTHIQAADNDRNAIVGKMNDSDNTGSGCCNNG